MLCVDCLAICEIPKDKLFMFVLPSVPPFSPSLPSLHPYPRAVHAAILAINEVLDKDDPKETLAALLIPSAMLAKVERENSNRYHNSLCQSKRDKALRSEEQVCVCVCYTFVCCECLRSYVCV